MSRTRVVSLSMHIDGFMRENRFPRGWDIFQHDDGSELTPAEALAFLTLEKAKGRKLIPCNGECGNPCRHAPRGCTGFDYQEGGCPGRYREDGDG